MTQKVFFFSTNKIAKTLVKNEINSLYKKDTVFFKYF